MLIYRSCEFFATRCCPNIPLMNNLDNTKLLEPKRSSRQQILTSGATTGRFLCTTVGFSSVFPVLTSTNSSSLDEIEEQAKFSVRDRRDDFPTPERSWFHFTPSAVSDDDASIITKNTCNTTTRLSRNIIRRRSGYLWFSS